MKKLIERFKKRYNWKERIILLVLILFFSPTLVIFTVLLIGLGIFQTIFNI